MVLFNISRIMQAQIEVIFCLAKIVFYPLKNISFYCCLLIIASIITMFSFQGASEFLTKETQWSNNSIVASVNFFFSDLKGWWRLAGSNRWPPACKAGALPAELNPQILIPFMFFFEVVGQNGLEPSTSRLSVVCSSQLSYWPIFRLPHHIRYIFKGCTF